jgi:predicted patatin/cPLA2 family phospholipase
VKGKKTAIFIHGGAIKGAFAAGAVCRLSELGVINVDLIIGASSGAATAAYFAGKQFKEIREIWTKEVSSKKLVNYADIIVGRPVFNLTYLIEEVFRRKYPLDTEAIAAAVSELQIPLCNYPGKATEFFSSHQPAMRTDFWNILHAAMTMHEEHILWNTPWEAYVDADLDPFALYRTELVSEDWNVIVIVNHHELESTLRKRIGLQLFLLLQARHFPIEVRAMLMRREAYIRSGLERFDSFIARHKALVLRPEPNISLGPLSVIERSATRLLRLYEAGEIAADQIAPSLDPFINRSAELGY